ncbi:MAG: hypothetical protein H0X66_01825 [Verrucomicrobia bacterium]|nr:hypothetical protein [Verrucomicrobiota bacterium]
MNRRSFLPKYLLWTACLTVGLYLAGSVAGFSADKTGKKIDIQLVWGTNEEKSPDETHKRLSAQETKKLRMFKWKHYFLVKRATVIIKPDVPTKKRLSEECEVQLKDVGNSMLEVELWGKGKLTRKIKEKVTKEDSVTIAGDAANDSAWLILIKEVP